MHLKWRVSGPLLLLVISFSSVNAAAAAVPAAPTNVILITLDTTRADRMGFMGSNLGLTPSLDALAKQSVIFTRAYSQVPLTTASHASILTGTYPQFNQVTDFGVALAEDLPYGPYIFRGNGYHTAAFVASLVLDPESRSAPGFDRGFDTYDSGFHRRREGEDRYQAIERRGTEVVDHAIAWLNAHPKGPYFIWIHLYDAHDPYDPPEPYKTNYAATPYNGEIAYQDFAVGQLMTYLKSRGLYENALIAVMADHGEALGQHGESTHGMFLYDETIHVPLLFKLPRERSAGARIENRVGLVDVMPTILQVAGIAIPKEMQGESLLPEMQAPRSQSSGSNPASVSARPNLASGAALPHERPIYSESDYPHRTFGWSSLRSLRTGKYLFIEAPEKELYDESLDPNSEHNLSAKSVAVASTLRIQLEALRDKTTTSKEAPKISADPGLQERLNALGYVASDNTSSAMPGIKESGADPKNKIEVVNLLHRAEMAKEDMRFQEAVPLLEEVIALEPNLPITYLQLGTALSSLKKYEKAVPILRKAVEMRPDLTIPRYQLGSALFETGDFAGAAEQFQTSIARSPNWPEAHLSLATAYARLGRMTDAVAEYERVIALRPNHYSAHLLMGRAMALSGNPAGALPFLMRAVELQPKSPEPHRFLADAYVQLGQQADADRERATAERLRAAGGQ